MAPRDSISMAQICCCVLKPIPGGFSWRKLTGWLKWVILCRCIICHILVWFGWFYIILWFIFLPQDPKFTITNASLTQFNFTTDNNTSTLHYNLALDITIRNPSIRTGMYYHRIKVSATYRKKKFGLVTLTDSVPFYQGHKSTTVLHHVVLQGKQNNISVLRMVKFGQHDVSEFDSETAAGVYSIDVQVTIWANARFGKLKAKFLTPGSEYGQLIDCKLKVPLSVNNDTSGSGFKATKCGDVHIFPDS